MSSDDLFDDLFPATLRIDPSPTSLGSTPIDYSGVTGEIASASTASALGHVVATEGHQCPDCLRVLKTKSGFTRHMTTHKINSYNFRKPMEEELDLLLPGMFKNVVDEIRSEPAVGETGFQKKNFMSAFCITLDSTAATSFRDAVYSSLTGIVLTKSKVMPSAQHEDALTRLNRLLADADFFDSLRDKLLCCVPEEEGNISNSVAERIIWRITSKFMYKIQEAIFQKMKLNHVAAHATFTMSDYDMEAFKEYIGKILRTLYRFGMNSENMVWKLRCLSMRERFVVASDQVDTVSSTEFVDAKLWQNPAHISLSDGCFNVFLGLEKIVQALQDGGSPCTAEIVFDSVITPENLIILSDLRKLSQGILSEDVALDFLKEIIKSLVALSTKWDARRKRDIARNRQKTKSVATRSDLKRNPKQKSVMSSAVVQGGEATNSRSLELSAQRKTSSKETIPPPTSKQKSSGSKTSKATLIRKASEEVIPSPASSASGSKTQPKTSKTPPTPKTTKKRSPKNPTGPEKRKSARQEAASQVETNVTGAIRKSSRVKRPAQK